MYVSITHLRLKSFWKVFQFFKYNGKVQRQIKTANGVLTIEGKGTNFVSFYTKTSWNTKDDMLVFMRSGAHANAMKSSSQFAMKVTTTGFESESVPSWKEAIELIKAKN